MPRRLRALADAARVAAATRSSRRPAGLAAAPRRLARPRRGTPGGRPLAAARARRLRGRGGRGLRRRRRRRAALARAAAPASVALRHGSGAGPGVRGAASPSIVAPMLSQMSLHTGTAGAPGAGIPDSALPGPFPVGEYAAALREQAARVRARAADRRARQPARGAHPRLLRAARRRRRDPVRGLAAATGRRCSRASGQAPAEGMQVVVAGGCDYYPGSATSSPGFSFAVTDLRVAGEGDLLAQIDRLRKQLDARGRCSSARRRSRARSLPRTIGVVTGESGKARDDVLAALAPPRLGRTARVGLRPRAGPPRGAGDRPRARRPRGARARSRS